MGERLKKLQIGSYMSCRFNIKF